MRGRRTTCALALAATSALVGGVARAEPAGQTGTGQRAAVTVSHVSAAPDAASVQVTCRRRAAGDSGCPVTVELTATRTVTRGHRTAPPALTLVTARHTVLTGRTSEFTLTLSARGRALLKRSPGLVERLRVTVGGDPVLTRRITR